jgi:hypothetical protein
MLPHEITEFSGIAPAHVLLISPGCFARAMHSWQMIPDATTFAECVSTSQARCTGGR